MYTLNGWWFLSSGGSYPQVFTVVPVLHAVASSVLEIEAVHNLRKVRMYLNVLSLCSTIGTATLEIIITTSRRKKKTLLR